MEFDIDTATVRAVLDDEYERTRVAIAEHGPVAACRLSAQRHDARLAAAPDAATLACPAGCSWCCYFSVDVRAVEVLSILEFVEARFTPEQRAQLARDITANARATSGLSAEQRAQRNIKCPFLLGGRCSIYAARPQTCRNYHATSSAGCKRSYEEPHNLDIDPDFAPLTYQIGGAHVDAFSKAMGDAGYDTNVYELNVALAAALHDPDAIRARFIAKQKPFSELNGMEAPLEFFELSGD